MTLLVRDEEDIIEDNLRFHLDRGVDHVVVTDNNSVDGTRDIVGRYEAAGHATVIDEPEDTYAQAAWVTRMARLAHDEHGADWVINCDADEFWWPLDGDLKSVLGRIPPEYGLVLVPRVNFRPVPDERGPFHQRMRVRETRSLNSLGDPLPPKAAHRGAPDVIVAQGNHLLWQPPMAKWPGDPGIEILHFPLRSYRQFENKIVKGGQALERNPDGPRAGVKTWRALYEAYKRGELPSRYETEVVGAGDVAAGVADGSLTIDDRLARALTPAAPG